MTDMLPFALKYAARGWPVLPLRNGSKEPATAHGYKDASTDEPLVKERFAKPCNIGVRVGPEADLIAIDPDNKGGKEGSARLSELEARLGALPTTYTVETRYGKHYYFKYPKAWLDVPLKAEYAPGLDIKFKGYVVAPPSKVGTFIYEVINDADAVELPEVWIKEAIKEALDVSDWDRARGSSPSLCDEYGITMSDVLKTPAGARRTADGYKCKHPIHSATGPGNLSVNRNVWYCFRHHVGGDPVKWVAIRERFIDCADADQRLDKDVFLRVKDVLRRDGLINNETRTPVIIVDKPRDELPTLEYDETVMRDLCHVTTDKDGNEKRITPAPGKIAAHLLNLYHFLTFRDTLDVYYYDPSTGLYHAGGQTLIGEWIQTLIGERLSTHYVDETIDQIRRQTGINRAEVDPPLNLIPVQNGILDIDTGEVSDYSPETPFFVNHPARYARELLDSGGGDVERFIKTTLPADDIDTIQEIAGACFYREYLYKKALMLVGDGDNGKSLLLTLINAALGDAAVSTRTLYELTYNRFAIADLYHKNANIQADIGGGEISFTGRLKTLTGGDRMTVEHKHTQPFQFVNYATLIFSTNDLPEVKNADDVFYKRWILVEMPYAFVDNPIEEYERQRDANLEDKITTDDALSWFFTWAIEGLKRLLRNGRFTESESTQGIMTRWIAKTDSLQAFVATQVNESKGNRVKKRALMEQYLAYCSEVNMIPYSERYVGLHLPKYVNTRTLETRPGRSWADIAVVGIEPLEIVQIADTALSGNLSEYDDEGAEE